MLDDFIVGLKYTELRFLDHSGFSREHYIHISSDLYITTLEYSTRFVINPKQVGLYKVDTIDIHTYL